MNLLILLTANEILLILKLVCRPHIYNVGIFFQDHAAVSRTKQIRVPNGRVPRVIWNSYLFLHRNGSMVLKKS